MEFLQGMGDPEVGAWPECQPRPNRNLGPGSLGLRPGGDESDAGSRAERSLGRCPAEMGAVVGGPAQISARGGTGLEDWITWKWSWSECLAAPEAGRSVVKRQSTQGQDRCSGCDRNAGRGQRVEAGPYGGTGRGHEVAGVVRAWERE